MDEGTILARIDLLERRVAVLEASRAQSMMSIASVNAARQAKRKEMMEAVELVVWQHPTHSAKQILKGLMANGVAPSDLPKLRTVQRLVARARQSLGATRDAGD